MKKVLTFLSIIFLTINLHSLPGFSMTGSYLFPLNPPEDTGTGSTVMDRNFSLGLEYGFWGIFLLTGNVYTDITWNSEYFLGVEEIITVGLFSAGIGVDIPMGPLHFVADWQKFYDVANPEGDVFDFSDSFKYGLKIQVNKVLSLEAYSRRHFNFSKKAKLEHSITKSNLEFIGLAIGIHPKPLWSYNPYRDDSWDEEW